MISRHSHNGKINNLQIILKALLLNSTLLLILRMFLLFLYQFDKSKTKIAIVIAMCEFLVSTYTCSFAAAWDISKANYPHAFGTRIKAVKRIITKSSILPHGAQRRRHPLYTPVLPSALLSLTSQVSRGVSIPTLRPMT